MKKTLLWIGCVAAVIACCWSLPASAAIVLNEAFTQGTKNNTFPDFVELYNDSDAPVDVSGYRVYDPGAVPPGTKPKKVIPAGTVIPAYGFLAINTDYTTDSASDFGLGSSGDEVWLEDASGTVIDHVVIPALAVNQSYMRIPDGGQWRICNYITKGESNVLVKMNEIYSTGTNDNPDWIELYNNSSDTMDISGYKIYDNGALAATNPKPKKTMPAGTKLAPKGFFVVVTDRTGDPSDFGLSSSGEKVWLEDETGVVVDSVAFVAMVAGESYSRVPDGGIWQKTTNVTRGASNGAASAVAEHRAVVSEYRLLQNYPNPFNPNTQIEFYLPTTTQVRLTVHNLLGELIQEIASHTMTAGWHRFTFDGTGLASGIYLYRLQTSDFSTHRQMVLMR